MRIQLDEKLTLGEICNALSAKNPNSANAEISCVVTHSEEAKAGDLFFALGGERFDGENFVSDVLSRGAFAVSKQSGRNIITVPDTAAALLGAASLYKSKLKGLKATVAITGSVGKTTTKDFLAAILSVKYKVHKSSGNQNNNIGLPYTVFSAPRDTEILVLEMGMNHPGEISELSKCSKPDIGIITNIGTAHIGNLGSREKIAKAKLEILDGMEKPLVIVPNEEELIRDFDGKIGVSKMSDNAYARLTVKEENADGTVIDYRSDQCEITDLYLRTPGLHLAECLALAICAAEKLSLSSQEVISGVSLICGDILRQKYIRFSDYTIYDDTYNSSPEAIAAAISLVKRARGECFSLVLGDMLELGEHSTRLHREVGELVAKSGALRLYTFGPLSRHIAEAAISAGMSADRVFENEDVNCPEGTAEQIMKNRQYGETIIFKGSHGMRLDRIINILMKTKEG